MSFAIREHDPDVDSAGNYTSTYGMHTRVGYFDVLMFNNGTTIYYNLRGDPNGAATLTLGIVLVLSGLFLI